MKIRAAAGILSALLVAQAGATEKQILWGDTHLHTNRSFDAFTNRNFSVGPDEAYRFARGLHGSRRQCRRGRTAFPNAVGEWVRLDSGQVR